MLIVLFLLGGGSLAAKMLLVSATFNLPSINLLLMAALATYKSTLNGISLETRYSQGKTQAGSVYVHAVMADITYSQAEISCLNMRSDLFSVNTDMSVKELMVAMNIGSIWTGIFKSLTTSTFVDIDQMPPVTRTKHDNISMEEMNLSGFDETKGIILRLKDDKLAYVSVPKTENHKAVCTDNIPFPYKTKDLLSLKTIRDNMVKEITILSDTVKVTYNKLEKELLVLPRINDSTVLTVDREVSLQSTIETQIGELSLYSDRVRTILDNIDNPINVIALLTEQSNFVQSVRFIERVCKDAIEEPLLLVGNELLKGIGPESVTTLQLSGTGTNLLLVTLESKDERDKNRIGVNLETTPFPLTTPDNTTVGTTATTTSTTTTTTESPYIFDTRNYTDPTTETPTTTVPVEEPTPSWSDRWWAWIKNTLVNLRSLGQWLRFSLYFVTLYDIIIGIITGLNSCYIIYKLCATIPDRRRPGETGLRVALVRFFGRNKEQEDVPVPTQEQMPLNPMPTAPAMPIPEVKCLSTPVSVRPRTLSRRIQTINEYRTEQTSSEDDIMPYRSAMKPYKQVRMDMTPTIKVVKRRAPPTPDMPTTLYLRDGVPLHMY